MGVTFQEPSRDQSEYSVLSEERSQVEIQRGNTAACEKGWRAQPPEHRVLWDVRRGAYDNLGVDYPTTRSGITKSRSYGLRCGGRMVSLADTGAVVSLLIFVIGTIQLLGSITEVLGWESWSEVDPEGCIDIVLKTTIMIMGIVGLLCFYYNRQIHSAMRDAANVRPVKTQQDRDREEALTIKRDHLVTSIMDSHLKSNIRSHGPRYLLIGISVFLVNDLVEIASEWLNILILTCGNPNYPDPPDEPRMEFELDVNLVVTTGCYTLAVVILVWYVYGWLLSWWEVLRVGFISFNDIKYSGWPDRKAEQLGDGMRKIFFTTGFEKKSCWELTLQQMSQRSEFQKKLQGTSSRKTNDPLTRFIEQDCEPSLLEDMREHVREILTSVTIYNETAVKMQKGQVYASTLIECDGISKSHIDHNKAVAHFNACT